MPGKIEIPGKSPVDINNEMLADCRKELSVQDRVIERMEKEDERLCGLIDEKDRRIKELENQIQRYDCALHEACEHYEDEREKVKELKTALSVFEKEQPHVDQMYKRCAILEEALREQTGVSNEVYQGYLAEPGADFSWNSWYLKAKKSLEKTKKVLGDMK